MRLGVFGSRSLKDDRVAFLILDEIEATGASVIVTAQEPLGVCTVAQQVAKERSNATGKEGTLALELHFLNWRHRLGAYHERSQEVIDNSDKVLLIHDGKSQGTLNELEQVKKSGKPYRYEILEVEADKKALDERLDTFQGYHEKDGHTSKDTTSREALAAKLRNREY